MPIKKLKPGSTGIRALSLGLHDQKATDFGFRAKCSLAWALHPGQQPVRPMEPRSPKQCTQDVHPSGEKVRSLAMLVEAHTRQLVSGFSCAWAQLAFTISSILRGLFAVLGATCGHLCGKRTAALFSPDL